MAALEDIRLEKQTLKSLYYFLSIIKKIIDSSVNDVFLVKYDDTDYCGELYSGQYYYLKKIENNKQAYLWYGISYHDDIFIGILIEKDHNSFYDALRNGIFGMRDEYCFVDEYEDKEGLSFLLLNEYVIKINESKIEDQENILRDFFNHVNRLILGYIT